MWREKENLWKKEREKERDFKSDWERERNMTICEYEACFSLSDCYVLERHLEKFDLIRN